MEKVFVDEWQQAFGEGETEGSVGAKSIILEKNLILEKIDELEGLDWYLQDAHEGANIYSDKRF